MYSIYVPSRPPLPSHITHTPHLHRQQMSFRLLCGRSISLLLEKRLVGTFAHCFPRKTPLVMLEDLDSSQSLMDRFCDTELLESLDQHILQASQQGSAVSGVCVCCV